MKNNNIWIGKEDLNGDKELIERSKEEFFELPVLNDMAEEESTAASSKTSRRDFLKYLGFGLGAATIAASCDQPVRRAIPYVTKPDSIVPGVANYYASNFVKGKDFVPVLVKTREGRPIKIEGNKSSPITNGGTSARAQAMVLELYDSTRVQHPGEIQEDGKVKKMDWDKLDEMVQLQLNNNARVRILSSTNFSPSFHKSVEEFKNKYPNTELVTYDSRSNSAMLMANEKQFGQKALPSYRFDKADVIVNFNADFLGSWISPVEFAQQWIQKRKIKDTHKPEMSRMITFESFMSLTGSNADNRVMIKPSEAGLAIAKLHNEIASAMGGSSVSISGTLSSEKAEKGVKAAAKDLIDAAQAGKHSLIVAGSNNTAEQMLVNNINQLLGNYGHTIDWTKPVYTSQTVDADIMDLQKDMESGKVDALFVMGEANPVYSLENGEAFKSAMSKVPLTISTTVLPNETFKACKYACPAHHNLESWGDVRPKAGYYGLTQPTIAPLFDTRQTEASLLTWSEAALVNENTEDDLTYTFIRSVWEKEVFPMQKEYVSFRAFWDQSLHDGFVTVDEKLSAPAYNASLSGIGGKITKPLSSDVEIAFYETVNMGAGEYANNPWLQEMPDPLLRTVWDNILSVPVSWDGDNTIDGWKGLESGDLVELDVAGKKQKVTVAQQFGMRENTVSLAVGYGRTVCGRAGAGVGTNVYPMLSRDEDGNVRYYSDAKVSEKVGEDKSFASVQYHHTFGVKDEDPDTGEVVNVDEVASVTLAEGFQGSIVDRTIIRQADLDTLEDAIHDLQHEREHAQHLNDETLYPSYKDEFKRGHKWEMSIDLTSCIGCGACQVACISENNVPVVGKNEVRRHHEMTWLRIDRYFYGDFENPNTAYQPMMCQHCDNAPCENVCPVAATTHNNEGINQMAYNRCIGTRYCANNCPYKVRRFNWLDYTSADIFGWNEYSVFDNEEDKPFYTENLTRMVLNPDVTVRSRGVMEKCSFCVQRIQEAKLKAKNEMRPLVDSDLTTACASACPTGAITFGDVNDEESEINEKKNSPMNYYVLEEVNTSSSVGYHMKVVNRNKDLSDIDA
jgi:molybdopterin-containing oxidoreductase family iron-sulfur binding subunit